MADSLHRQSGSAYGPMHMLRMRKAQGPMCEHCAVWADEWHSEYCIDHDASSDLLTFSENQPWMCRAGQQPTHWPAGPGWVRDGWNR
jgi:hypothetical protein